MRKLLARLFLLSLLFLAATAKAQDYPCTTLVMDTSYWTPCGGIIQPSSLLGQVMGLHEPIQLPASVCYDWQGNPFVCGYQAQVVYYHLPQGCEGPMNAQPRSRYCP